MNKQTKFIIGLILILASYLIVKENISTKIIDNNQNNIKEENDYPVGLPTFSWSYEEFDKDEISQSTIFLTAEYENGVNIKKEIDTIEGGCNVFIDPDKDIYDKSEMIICYYAGLGRYYKIVKDEENFLVKRKIFEEYHPDLTPPKTDFETIYIF